MRLAYLAFLSLAACKPSATVENTMPVANLQSVRTVIVRGHTNAFAAQGNAMMLENSVLGHVQQQCGFERVERASNRPADVIIDLNITNISRGGGWLNNQAQANIDTLVVLTDGQSGELMGTARVHGKSSGMIVNNSMPESEAIEVVGKTVADLLAKSGCGGARVARVEPPRPVTPPPRPTGTGSGTVAMGSAAGSASLISNPVDESHRADAEALNTQGREKLQGGDMQGALDLFARANQLLPDARYEFNVCLALEALQRWAEADGACRRARGMAPEARLVEKIDLRLDLIAHHQ